MKCQILFSRKNKKNVISLSSADSVPSVASVKLLSFRHHLKRCFFFAWRFILNENILFRLIISYQKPFVFYIHVFCSQEVTPNINL